MAHSRPRTPSARPLLLAAVAIVAGDGCGGSDPECEVDEIVARDLGRLDPTDCGDIFVEVDASPDSHPELEEAHDCVQAAIDDDAPFVVIWSFSGTEGLSTQAYVGLPDEDHLELTRYHRSANPNGDYGTARSACGGLVALDPCDASLLRGFLCFECDQPGEPDVICEAAE